MQENKVGKNKMKVITFSNWQRASEVAKEMNPNHVLIEENQTRGTTYYSWVFSDDAVCVCYAHGEGKVGSRFQSYYLIRGTAWKVGRDETDLEFYGESVTVKPAK